MSDLLTDRTKFARAFMLLLILLVTIFFFRMIQNYLVATLFGALTAALSQPLYRRFLGWFGGRSATSASVTLVTVLILVVAPVLIAAVAVAAEAAELAVSARAWARAHPDALGELTSYLEGFPVLGLVAPNGDVFVRKLAELTASMSGFLGQSLSALAQGTVGFMFQLFVMLYATFHFLLKGGEVLERWTNSTPLTAKQMRGLLETFASVTRATIKGTLVIGIVQGAVIGGSFAAAGLPGAFFWGTVMAVLSAIPVIGPSLVYVPAVIYLFALERFGAAVGLAIWCTLVVNVAGNILRPRLVGRDTQMPDGLVLLGTLGGISMFGVVGLIVGPMLAAGFMSLWELFRAEFRGLLIEPPAPEATEGSG